jgi:hypothetical protein
MHFRLFSFVFLLSVTPAGMTQTYKWVDHDGTVSYSQTPPPSIQAETVDIEPVPATNGNDAKDGLKRLQQRLEDNREDRELAKEAERKAREATEIKQRNCAAARSNLEKLLNSGNRMLKTTDGSYIRLNESERHTRIQSARDEIEANCTR